MVRTIDDDALAETLCRQGRALIDHLGEVTGRDAVRAFEILLNAMQAMHALTSPRGQGEIEDAVRLMLSQWRAGRADA